ncbi:MAG: hypothetical protein HYX53_04660 [Chloroflexi bacterium]|nr:hypothetical protein [Chloroflexota bacterium]
MSSETQPCPDCRTEFEATDNYCRQCGMYLVALRPAVPARTAQASRALEPVRPGLPAPVKKAATALAIGTALQIGVGLAGRYLAGQAARQAGSAIASNVVRKPARSNGRRAVANDDDQPVAISETVVIRRIWLRRS